MNDSPLPFYRKTLAGFVPANDRAAEFHRKTKLGALVTLAGRRPRNLRQHRLWWALMQVIADNMDGNFSAETVCQVVKIRVGHVEAVKTRKGEEYIAKSISFAKLSQDQFDAFMERAIAVICTDILPGVGKAELRERVEEMIGDPAFDRKGKGGAAHDR